MKPRKSFLGVLGLLPIALVSAAACGGNAFENRGGGAAGGGNGTAGGGNGTAGSNSAGSGSSASSGSGSTGGARHGTAGAGSGAAGAGVGGAIVAGGASNGGAGSGGSGGLDVRACTSNTQCIVVPKSCCVCDRGSIANLTAINSAYQMQFNAECALLDCASCPEPPQGPGDPSLFFVATCELPPEALNAVGHCKVVDLRETAITACKTAADCALRSGTGCCEGCGDRIVSINRDQGSALSSLVCGNEPIGCPACLPIFDDYRTTCTNGRCGVQELPCTAKHPCP